MRESIFISYAHAHPKHQTRVLELVEALRGAGLQVAFDGDVTTPQGPPEGWPRWMEDQIDTARWVLVVCDEVYERRFRGKEAPDVGRGARWEGAIVRQELYDQGSVNARFIPVLLEGCDANHIPKPLRGATHYRCPADLGKLTTALSSNAAAMATPPALPAAPAPTVAAEQRPPRGVDVGGSARSRERQAAWLSAGSFGAAMLLVALWLWQGRRLADQGESAAFYYLILVVLGASVGAFLFGALRSLGRYRGRVPGGHLELGGAAVAALLVIWGGARFAPLSLGSFALTVYVHDEDGAHEPLPGVGRVLLDLRGDRRSEPVGEKGQAYFAEIPASFRGQRTAVWLESDEYELAEAGEQRVLDQGSVYLRVRRKGGRVVGRVQDSQGRAVVSAAVHVAGVTVRTDANGRFDVAVSGDRMSHELVVEVQAEGFAAWRGSVVPNSNDVGVVLTKEP